MNYAALMADAILVVHVGVVVFVVAGLVLIVLGGLLGWRWIRNRWFRLAHLATIVFVALQTWLGELCPLTVWEQQLRAAAGQPHHDHSFIEYWLSRLLFVEAPWWVFIAGYSVFAALVMVAWWRWPPDPQRR